jgi:hypothetical protein
MAKKTDKPDDIEVRRAERDKAERARYEAVVEQRTAAVEKFSGIESPTGADIASFLREIGVVK